MKQQQLLIATTNLAKLEEWKRFLSELPVELVGLTDVGIDEIVEEVGATFQENARLKATGYTRLSGLLTLGDDGGFEVDFLNGTPGVRGRRLFGGKDATDEELIAFVLEKLAGVPPKERGARLRVVTAVAAPDGSVIYEKDAAIQGYIAEAASQVRSVGYPYRSLLFLPQFGKMFSELNEEEHEQVNHRRKIAPEIARAVLSYLGDYS